ncbi:hypothetical protein [Fibrella aquatica]|jgi:hypothetical protein|uniref:hypothetical protein n=1 Tax=Fibrella aquatica TaxID=3242487 RepID=UPI0035204A68
MLAQAQLQRPYGKPVRWAVTGEVGGLSPLLSLNAEYAPVQFRKSFLVIRGGVGHLFTNYSILTLPHALTWNVVLNGQTRGCLPREPRNSFFAEVGLGSVYLPGAMEGVTYRWSPILGVRRYFAYNVRANGFWKVQLTPVVSGQWVPWGGVGLGLLID